MVTRRGALDNQPMSDIEAVDHVLTTTRSVRKRLDLDRPVAPATILECLRVAVQAPTAANSQTWRWLVVTDPVLRAALADIYRRAGAGYLEAKAAEAGGDPQTNRVYHSAVHLSENLHRVPVHVIPCVEGRVDGKPNVVAASLYGSIIPAAWSFMLALRARGLGSVWTTLHLLREQEAADLLGIPDTVTQVALLPVAYTVGTEFRPAARPPVEDVTFGDRWGQALPG